VAIFALLGFGSAAFATDRTWTVAAAPRGVVRFVVEGPLDDVRGETRSVVGSFSFDGSTVTMLRGVFAVDLSTVRTGIDQRDEDMRVEFLETKRFPFAVLTIDGLRDAAPDVLNTGSTVSARANGTFELHGVRRTVSLPLKVRKEGDERIAVSGEFPVPFADYGVARPQRLFLKLGDTALVRFEVTFVPKAALQAPLEEVVVPQPTVTSVLPAGPPPRANPPRKPKPALSFGFLFKSDDAKARGEKLFHSAMTGGAGNAMTCFHCHAKSDEREGLLQKDGHVRAAQSLYNAAHRPVFWGGFASTVAEAASICQKQFMKGEGLSTQQQSELQAFVEAISPDAAPELDFRASYRSMETLLRDPTGGDPVRGKKLAERYCMTCHLEGRVGPPWALGLYEPDWVVRRVRRLEGHQNKQMPAWTISRLPDSELRDIVTYLTRSPNTAPIFQRTRAQAP
jgi:polyisoprenoid-binding protein YceI/mono/diheme cytochrome c family protein